MVRFQACHSPVAKRIGMLGKGARATGAQCRNAIVAVARQITVDIWRINTGRCAAAQLGLRAKPALEERPAAIAADAMAANDK